MIPQKNCLEKWRLVQGNWFLKISIIGSYLLKSTKKLHFQQFWWFWQFFGPPLISKNLKTQIQILKMLICRGEMISFPPSPTKAIYEMKPFMFLPVQCIADEKYHFKLTLISAFVIIQRSYTIISFISSLRSISSLPCLQTARNKAECTVNSRVQKDQILGATPNPCWRQL